MKERSLFTGDSSLRNIETGVTADSFVNVDNSKDVGTAVIESLVGQNVNSKTSIKVDGELLVDPQLLFQRCTTVANGLFADISEIFKYELCSVPSSLFDNNGLPRQANKSILADAIWDFDGYGCLETGTNVHHVLDGHMPRYSVNKNYLQEIECEPDYFMPHEFQSNRYRGNGVEHCEFKKDRCNSEGMKLCSNGTTTDDGTCNCDYTNHYVPELPNQGDCFYAKNNRCQKSSMCTAFHYRNLFSHYLVVLYLKRSGVTPTYTNQNLSDQPDSGTSEAKCHCPTESRCIQKDENNADFITLQSEVTSTTLQDVSDKMNNGNSGDNNKIIIERLILIVSLSLCAIQFSVICYCLVVKKLVERKNTIRAVSFHGQSNTSYPVGTGDHYEEIDIELERNSNFFTHNTPVRRSPIQIESIRDSPGHMITITQDRSIKGTIAEALGDYTVSADENSSSDGNRSSHDFNYDSGYLNPYQPLQTNDSNTAEHPYNETTNDKLSKKSVDVNLGRSTASYICPLHDYSHSEITTDETATKMPYTDSIERSNEPEFYQSLDRRTSPSHKHPSVNIKQDKSS
ncbi:unnamed protein product [Mytilus coruscus]|uniref:Uncharacterized protein n=1 Tax=Mytilus coruscus TaxID=42192 RepID=A0A6J8ASJ3_MYTCO|nr:unnamed protein product [Mytilus coruscus]